MARGLAHLPSPLVGSKACSTCSVWLGILLRSKLKWPEAAFTMRSSAQTVLTIAGSSSVYPVVNDWAQAPSIQSSYSFTVEGGH